MKNNWRKSGRQEGELQEGSACDQAIHSCGICSVGVSLDAPRKRPGLFIRDCGARWAGKMNDFKPVKADLTAPFLEIGGRIVERIAELDQHV